MVSRYSTNDTHKNDEHLNNVISYYMQWNIWYSHIMFILDYRLHDIVMCWRRCAVTFSENTKTEQRKMKNENYNHSHHNGPHNIHNILYAFTSIVILVTHVSDTANVFATCEFTVHTKYTHNVYIIFIESHNKFFTLTLPPSFLSLSLPFFFLSSLGNIFVYGKRLPVQVKTIF